MVAGCDLDGFGAVLMEKLSNGARFATFENGFWFDTLNNHI